MNQGFLKTHTRLVYVTDTEMAIEKIGIRAYI